MGRKDIKKSQRAEYHRAFDKTKFGHGTRFVKKKEESALGGKKLR